MKILLTILLVCSLSGQVVYDITTVANDTTIVAVKDTISVEEQFLKEISDKALAKEERRKNWFITAVVLIVVYTLVDYYLE